MARILLTGDDIAGVDYVPLALFELRRMKAEGLTTGDRQVYLDDRASVRIVLDPYAGDKVYLNSSCPSIALSGFVDTQRNVSPTTVRKKSAPDVLADTEALNSSAARTMYDSYMPSKFTGTMRKVMQASIQRMIKVALAANRTTLDVDYHFGNSFGVIKNVSTGRQFLIKITGTAVYYIPAVFCNSTNRQDGAATEVTQLMGVKGSSGVKLCDLDPLYSWDNEIGWAFSYTAPRASIINVGGEQQGGHVYKTVELCHINFSFNTTNGFPESAALERGTPTIFWLDRPMTPRPADWYGFFTVPRYGLANPEESEPRLYGESVDFGIPYPYMGQRPLNYSVRDLPVYVYYTEVDGMVTCNYSYDPKGKSVQTLDTTTGEMETHEVSTYWFDEGGLNAATDDRPFPDEGASFVVVGLYSVGGVVGVGTDSGTVFGYGATLVEAYTSAWYNWSADSVHPPGIFDDFGGNYAPLSMVSGAVPYVDIKWEYLAPATSTWFGTLKHEGEPITNAGSPIYYSVASGDVYITGTSSDTNSNSSLTLSLTDREAHLVYGETVTVHKQWAYTNASGWQVVNQVTYVPKQELWLYNGDTRTALDAAVFGQNLRMLSPHPLIELSFKSSRAAFDVSNFSHDVAPGVFGGQVTFKNGVYSISNRISGWIGVV